jgi:tetratricopeptide (TPR) repeat protein
MDFPKSYEVQAQWLAAINLSDIETDYLQIRKSIEPLLSEKSEHSTPILLALLARVADKAGNKEEAIHLIKEALFQWQNEALWVEFYASKCFECGDIQNGFTALEKYLTINPTDLEIRRTLAKAYFDFQQYNSSISHYQFLAENL